MGRKRVDQTSYNFFSFNEEGKNGDKGTPIVESFTCECGLSGETFAGWKEDAGSLGKTLDWELHLFSSLGSATNFLVEVSKWLMALASVFLLKKMGC